MKKSIILLLLSGLLMTGCSEPVSAIDYFKDDHDLVYEAGSRITLQDDFFGQDKITGKKEAIEIIPAKDQGLTTSADGALASESQSWLSPGTYTLEAKNREETVPFTITVQDTAAPVIHRLEDEYFLEMDHSMNLIDTLGVEDETAVHLSLYTDLDTRIPGDYDCLVQAVDEGGNVTEETVVIHVLDPLFPKAKRLAYHSPSKLWVQKTIEPDSASS